VDSRINIGDKQWQSDMLQMFPVFSLLLILCVQFRADLNLKAPHSVMYRQKPNLLLFLRFLRLNAGSMHVLGSEMVFLMSVV